MLTPILTSFPPSPHFFPTCLFSPPDGASIHATATGVSAVNSSSLANGLKEAVLTKLRVSEITALREYARVCVLVTPQSSFTEITKVHAPMRQNKRADEAK